MVKVNLKRTFSSGEGSGHQVGIWPTFVVGKITCWKCGGGGSTRNVCPSKYRVATKTDKKEERKMIFIQTADIPNSTLSFILFLLLILI